MVGGVLSTKIRPPLLQTTWIPRARLVDRFRQGLAQRLTLLSAPAGFGKTTLVAGLITQSTGTDETVAEEDQLTFAWLALDETDNDPALFFTYLVAALQTVEATLGEGMLPLLQSPQAVAPPMLLGTLINELAALPRRLVLVLDDYHLIESAEVHEALAYLLNHQPPQLHLTIITRADPPLPLARLRARRQMVEIRAEDLRFSSAEAAAFLQQAWGIDMLPEQVAALEARTEGWIAGLQLAALSMERLHTHDEIHQFITAFSGSHRYVLDYLADEVLEQQPANVQDFLLRTSILNRLSAALCDDVLETSASQAMLERLESANLFLIPLDDRREWYRYHHLFADLLRHRLKHSQPQSVALLHHRASLWYESNGYTGEAIAHALHGENTNRAAQLIEQARWQIHGNGELTTLRRWLQMLPQAYIDSRSTLAILHTWHLLYAGKMQDAEAYLEQVTPLFLQEAQAGIEGAVARQGELAVLRAQIAFNHGDGVAALEYVSTAETQIPVDNLILRSMLANMSGKAKQMQGYLEQAANAYATAAELGVRSGNLIAALSGFCNQAALCEQQGRLRRSLALQQEALALAQDRHGRPIPLAGVPHVGIGKIYREWNRLDVATEHLDKAIRLGQQSGLDGIVVDGSITLALLHMAQGADAHATLRQAEAVVHQWQEPLTDLRLAAFSARLWLAQGHPEPAITWADTFIAEYGDAVIGGTNDQFEIEYTVVARVWLAQEKPEQALALLDRLLPTAESAGRNGKVIEFLGLQALAHQAQGDRTQATAALTRALTLAQPEGYVRTFADEGRPMGELLARVAMGESAVAAYALALLDTFSSGPSGEDRSHSPSPEQPATTGACQERASDLAQWLAEPLSERELEVLRLVAQGCSNREIGASLYISIATVKKHMENIHGKLYVNNRTQAVARARELGLL